MKKSYNGIYIIAFYISSILCLDTLQGKTQSTDKPKGSAPKSNNPPTISNNSTPNPSNSSGQSTKANAPAASTTPNNSTPNNVAPSGQSTTSAQPTTTSTGNTPPTATTNESSSQKNNTAHQKTHSIIIHATRILPKKTLISVNQLMHGLSAYSTSNPSVINATNLQNIQKSLTDFAKALEEKHPYLNAEKSKADVKLDVASIIYHIQMILKSLPWYIQNPKVLGTNINLHEFSKQLHILYNQVKTAEAKNIIVHPKISSPKQKHSKSSKPDRVKVTSLIPDTYSEFQEDAKSDSDGSPINETLTEANAPALNNSNSPDDVVAQALSTQSKNIFEVVDKRGRIIASYKRTGKKDDTFIGELKSIQGKISLVIEGINNVPKTHGASKKIAGYILIVHPTKEKITLYHYHEKGLPKKHRS